MKMQVPRNPCSSCRTQVHPDVVAIRRVGRTQSTLRPLCPHHQLVGRPGRQLGERRPVPVRNHHNVAGIVGEAVEAHKDLPAAADQQRCPFRLIGSHAMRDGVVRGEQEIAENTVPILRPGTELRGHTLAGIGVFARRLFAGDVAVPPGCPEVFHPPSIEVHAPYT